MSLFRPAVSLALLALVTAPLSGQAGTLASPCAPLEEEASRRCFAVAQAVESAHPQLGLLIGGGNPILGVAGTGGLRLARVPRIDVSPRLNIVFVRLPDILAAELGGPAERLSRSVGIPAPALSTTVGVGIFPGVDVAPGIGGIGALDLLAGATWLPFGLIDTEGFSETSPFAWSAGGRVGILRESFTVPAVSLAVQYRSLGRTSFGRVCRSAQADEETCLGPGDAGEFSFDLGDVSSRFAVSKRFFGVAGAAGLGYDRFTGDVDYAIRFPSGTATSTILRFDPVSLRSDRWSVFANLGYDFLVSSVVVEAGWMQGGAPLPGYDVRDFDPRSGTWFGSLGGRIGL